jgi:hypothetical protein
VSYVLPILALAAICGLWIVFQQWIARHMPGVPGIGRRCGRCQRDGACTRDAGESDV